MERARTGSQWTLKPELVDAIKQHFQKVQKPNQYVAIPVDTLKQYVEGEIKTNNVRSIALQLKRKYPDWSFATLDKNTIGIRPASVQK